MAEQKCLCNFVIGHLTMRLCEIIFNLDKMSFKGISIFRSGGHFVQGSGMFCAI